MTKLRLIVASGLLLLGLAACTSGETPPPSTSPQPGASTQPTSSVTSIPESEYPNPYAAPSSSP